MPTKKYKNIIWDWNGTLLNDLWLSVEIANQMLADQNSSQIDTAAYQDAFGFPITAYYEKIGIDLQKESFDELTEKFVTTYNKGVINCQLHERVMDLLNHFQATAKTQFILTAAHSDMVNPLLEKFSITAYFKVIEGVDNFKAEGKVDRGVQMMKNNQLNPEETVLIGDTYHDFEVASAMGIDCIMIANGHQSKERLTNNTNPQTLVLNELKELILS